MKRNKMERNRNITEEVEKTLSSLDHFPKLELDPFFVTRVEGRIERFEQHTFLNWFFEIRWVKPAILSVFLLINVLTLLKVINNSNSTVQLSQDDIQAFADDYEISPGIDSYLVLNGE